MTTLVDDFVPDELWTPVKPLLPASPRPPYGGRHRTIFDRACSAAIVESPPRRAERAGTQTAKG